MSTKADTVEIAPICAETRTCGFSFPRSAWECRLGRSASARWAKLRSWSDDAERRGEHSHAERGNEGSVAAARPYRLAERKGADREVLEEGRKLG